MSLLDRIQTDLNEARRTGDIVGRNCLVFLLSEARAVGKKAKPPREPTDEEVISAVRKIIGQNEETLSFRESPDPRQQNELLQTYLPQQMDEAKLTETITAMIPEGEKSPRLMGIIMGRLKADHPGQYDPALASRITKNLLQG